MAKVVFSIMMTLTFVIGSSGCSINGFGIPGSIEEKSIYSDFSHVIQTKAVGLHIDTRATFELNLGFIEREIVYPRVVEDDATCMSLLFSPLVSTPLVESTTTNVLYAKHPVKFSVNSYGARVSFSPASVDINLGYLNRKVTRVSAEDSFSMFYSNQTQQKKQGIEVCALIKLQLKEEHHEN